MAAAIGNLRHRITFQNLILAPDGQGGSSESWADFATVWAELTPVTSKERLYAQRIEAIGTHRIVIRYLDGISPTMRITFMGRVFQIKGIDKVDERRFWMKLDVEENTGT